VSTSQLELATAGDARPSSSPSSCPRWPSTLTSPARSCPIYLSAHLPEPVGSGHMFMSLVGAIHVANNFSLTLDVELPKPTPHNMLCHIAAPALKSAHHRARGCIEVGQTSWGSRTSTNGKLVADIGRMTRTWRSNCTSRHSKCARITVHGDAPPAINGIDVGFLRSWIATNGREGISSKSSTLDVAIHVRRGDLTKYLSHLRLNATFFTSQAFQRLIPNTAYTTLLDSLVATLRQVGWSQHIRLEFHAEGSHAPARVLDVSGEVTDFEAISHSLGWNASVRIGSAEPLKAFQSICGADVFVAAPSGFSHLIAQFCARPVILTVPFPQPGLGYDCVPNAHSLQRGMTTSFAFSRHLKLNLTSTLTPPANLSQVLRKLVSARLGYSRAS